MLMVVVNQIICSPHKSMAQPLGKRGEQQRDAAVDPTRPQQIRRHGVRQGMVEDSGLPRQPTGAVCGLWLVNRFINAGSCSDFPLHIANKTGVPQDTH